MRYVNGSPFFRELVRSAPVWDLPVSGLAAKVARDDVLGQLEAWFLPSLIDDALLVASELVTNAVRAGGPVHLALRVVVIDVRPALRIEVTDCGPGLPSSVVSGALPGPDVCGGRGLPLVDMLADSWGSERRAGLNLVWAHLYIGARAGVAV